MIQAGQRIRINRGRSAHIIRSETPYPSTWCGIGIWEDDTISPDPTLPLCATCARRKDTT